MLDNKEAGTGLALIYQNYNSLISGVGQNITATINFSNGRQGGYLHLH